MRILDKFYAIWCILSSKEYIVYTCNKFTTAKGSKSTISKGVFEKLYGHNIFLEVIQEDLDNFK